MSARPTSKSATCSASGTTSNMNCSSFRPSTGPRSEGMVFRATWKLTGRETGARASFGGGNKIRRQRIKWVNKRGKGMDNRIFRARAQGSHRRSHIDYGSVPATLSVSRRLSRQQTNGESAGARSRVIETARPCSCANVPFTCHCVSACPSRTQERGCREGLPGGRKARRRASTGHSTGHSQAVTVEVVRSRDEEVYRKQVSDNLLE